MQMGEAAELSENHHVSMFPVTVVSGWTTLGSAER